MIGGLHEPLLPMAVEDVPHFIPLASRNGVITKGKMGMFCHHCQKAEYHVVRAGSVTCTRCKITTAM